MKNLLCKKLMYFVVVLSFVGVALAGQPFTDNGPTHDACDPANWGQGVIPDDSTTHPGDLSPAWYTDNFISADGGICYIGNQPFLVLIFGAFMAAAPLSSKYLSSFRITRRVSSQPF